MAGAVGVREEQPPDSSVSRSKHAHDESVETLSWCELPSAAVTVVAEIPQSLHLSTVARIVSFTVQAPLIVTQDKFRYTYTKKNAR